MPLSQLPDEVIQPNSFELADNADANAAQANKTYFASARAGFMVGSGGELGGVVKYPLNHNQRSARDTDAETPRLYQVEKKSDADNPDDPSIGENVQDRHMVSRAVASYQLDSLLQLGVVAEEKFGLDEQNRVFGISVLADGAGIQSEFRAEGPGSPKIGCFLNVDYSDPVIQRGLSDLEVSDYISGQIDRHAGNIFVDGSTGKVTGIDNDLAFPEASRETIQARETDRLGGTNNKSVAGMPQQMHVQTRNNILALDPEVLRQTLAGIRPPNAAEGVGGLTPAEIEGAVGRLEALQNELRNPHGTIQVVAAFNDQTYEAAVETQKARFDQVYDQERAGNNRATFDTCQSPANLDQCPKTSYLGSVVLKQKQAQVGIRLDQQDNAQSIAEGRGPKAPGVGLRPAHETPKAARDVEHAEFLRQLDATKALLKKNPAAIQNADIRQQVEGLQNEITALREKIGHYDHETAQLNEGRAGARLRSLASGGTEGRKDFYAGKKLDAEVDITRLERQIDSLVDDSLTPEFRNGLRQEVGAGRLLVDAGLPQEHVAAMSAQKRVDLMQAVSSNAPCANNLLLVERAVADGQMSPEVPDQILSMNKHSPRLAGKIAEIGAQEVAGTAPQGITAFTAGNALNDSYYQDKRGTTLSNLPSAAELGFEPQMHLQLDQADYDLMKAAVQDFNAQGLMTKVHFDDASRRVDVGYSSEEMAVLRASTTGTPLSMKANDIRNCFNKVVAIAQDTHQEAHQTLGSRALLDKMQDSRIDTTAAIFKQMNGFDYQPHDQKLNDATCTEIETKLAEPNVTNQEVISNLLTDRDMPGFVISENHGQTETKNFITENMAHLAQQGVGVVGIEHLSNPGLQDAVTAYLNDPDPNAVMNADLQAGLRGLREGKGGIYVNMVQEAKKHGIAVIGIDGPNLRTPDAPGLDSGAIRAAFMNSAGITNLDKKLAEMTPPGGNAPKFVLLAGGNHNISQPGLLQTGVPGLGQYYKVPNVSIAPKPNGGTEYPMELIRDTPANRQRLAPTAPAVNVAVNQPVPNVNVQANPALVPPNYPAPQPPVAQVNAAAHNALPPPPNYPAPQPPVAQVNAAAHNALPPPPNYPAPQPPGLEPPASDIEAQKPALLKKPSVAEMLKRTNSSPQLGGHKQAQAPGVEEPKPAGNSLRASGGWQPAKPSGPKPGGSSLSASHN
ncbi:MAG: TraB/GumN family protein [Prosthecobacter sp.]